VLPNIHAVLLPKKHHEEDTGTHQTESPLPAEAFHRRAMMERHKEEKTIDDLIYGQGVIINARWIMIGAGLLLVFWRSLSKLASLMEVRVSLVLLIGLAVMNFFLYTEVFRKRRTVATVVYLASVVDLIVISSIVFAQGGFTAESFVFYFPAMMALSVAFPPGLTVVYTLVILVVYVGICNTSLTAGAESETTPWLIIITRLLMIVGVVTCGYTYWRVERDRRRRAAEELLNR
jgi:hypothetical protein